ncbi:hypothetical protein QQX85_09425, partial [Klebsiella variicola]
TVCVVGKMRDLILQLSKSSIYSTKPLITQKVVLFYCASDRQHRKIRNFPGINIHHFYINEAQVSASLRIISCCGTLFIFK